MASRDKDDGDLIFRLFRIDAGLIRFVDVVRPELPEDGSEPATPAPEQDDPES